MSFILCCLLLGRGHSTVMKNEKKEQSVNKLLKIKIVQKRLKISLLQACVTCVAFGAAGSTFQARASAMEKARSPSLSQGDGTTESPPCDEWSAFLEGTSAVAVRCLDMYSGARSIWTLWASKHSLYWIRFWIGRQCSSCRASDMRLRGLSSKTRRAAACRRRLTGEGGQHYSSRALIVLALAGVVQSPNDWAACGLNAVDRSESSKLVFGKIRAAAWLVRHRRTRRGYGWQLLVWLCCIQCL